MQWAVKTSKVPCVAAIVLQLLLVTSQITYYIDAFFSVTRLMAPMSVRGSCIRLDQLRQISECWPNLGHCIRNNIIFRDEGITRTLLPFPTVVQPPFKGIQRFQGHNRPREVVPGHNNSLSKQTFTNYSISISDLSFFAKPTDDATCTKSKQWR